MIAHIGLRGGSAAFGGVAIALLCGTWWSLEGNPGLDPDLVLAAKLVRQLGHDDFDRREEAELGLVKLGEISLSFLHAAASDRDLEVARRAVELSHTILLTLRNSPVLKLRMEVIEPAKYWIGSPANETSCRPDETRHEVHLKRAALLGKYEVTQGEYNKVMKLSPSWFSRTGNGKDRVLGMELERFPVEQVTWFDAIDFCNRLSEMEGFRPHYKFADEQRERGSIHTATVAVTGGNGYRLPTEAEWEVGCRAGTASAYHFGRENTGREANLKPGPPIGYGGSPSWTPLNRTTTVGSYKPNDFNLCDMHGNVAEWVADWYDKDYFANSPLDDPPGPKTGTHRVVRGGSWMVPEGNSRASSRLPVSPNEVKETIGFRVARTP